MTAWLIGIGLAYLLVTLAAAVVVHRFPRRPVSEAPDWGRCHEATVATVGGGRLEVWRVDPEGDARGTVILIHGWGRNRDRMTGRARLFGHLGFTTILFSARDHGGSSRFGFMNALEFAKDAMAVLDWVGAPVILYGHSAGAGAAIIAAHEKPEQVVLLFLEGSYARTRAALMRLYRWFNPVLGTLLGPMILVWLRLFYGADLDTVSPARLASDLTMPVMLIHGGRDRRFPVAFANELKAAFAPGQASLFVAGDAGHSEASLDDGYAAAVTAFVQRHFGGPFPKDAGRRSGEAL